VVSHLIQPKISPLYRSRRVPQREEQGMPQREEQRCHKGESGAIKVCVLRAPHVIIYLRDRD